MQKWKICSLALALGLSLTACGGGEAETQQSYDPEVATQALLDSGAFSEQLESIDAGMAQNYFGLDAAPEEAAVYGSTGATAETAAVLVFDSEETASAAADNLEVWIEDQKAACEGYLPAEIPKLDGAILDQAGNSVVLVVAGDYDKAQAALDGLEEG